MKFLVDRLPDCSEVCPMSELGFCPYDDWKDKNKCPMHMDKYKRCETTECQWFKEVEE